MEILKMEKIMKNKYSIATTFFIIGFLLEMVILRRHYPYSILVLIIEIIAGYFVLMHDESKPTKHF